MLDNMILKLLENHIFGVKTSRFCHILCNVVMEVIYHYIMLLICKPLVVY